jgi:small conductance mechanosensitive channel
MRFPRFSASLLLLALALATGTPGVLRAQDTTATTSPPLEQALARISAAARDRDSLSVLADKATGEKDAVVEELLWQSQLDVQAGLLDATVEIERLQSSGADLAETRAVLQRALVSGWPRYRRQLERRERILQDLVERRDAAPPAKRLDIETQFAEASGRIARMYRDLVDVILALEHVGITVAPVRTFVGDKLSGMAGETRARMIVLRRANTLAKARVQRKADDADAQLELESSSAALSQNMQNLETEIALLERLGKDVTELRVALLIGRGTLSSAIFEPGVIQGVFGHWRQQFVEMLVTRGPHWLFVGLMVVIILTGFGLLAKLTRRVVRQAVRPAGFSQLLKDTIVDWSARLVNLIGLFVLLRQFGVQLGPMLAGLGIAGFALGFALQDTLANFAAGAMILAYHPYDVGDTVEVAGANGVVRNMSLFSTTILTDDNQTLIVPNRKMWGDVIRNTTAQSTRRVDMVFSVDHANDVATIERLLAEIAQADARVLKEPAPVVKLDKLAESSVNYVVRVWTQKANYWDVYWDITRTVKLRFDQDGIKFPQGEMRLSMVGERPSA